MQLLKVWSKSNGLPIASTCCRTCNACNTKNKPFIHPKLEEFKTTIFSKDVDYDFVKGMILPTLESFLDTSKFHFNRPQSRLAIPRLSTKTLGFHRITRPKHHNPLQISST